jgi:hypothetical protein
LEEEHIRLIAGFLHDHLIPRRPHIPSMAREWDDDRRARPHEQLVRPEIRDRHARVWRLGSNRDRLWHALPDGRTADHA